MTRCVRGTLWNISRLNGMMNNTPLLQVDFVLWCANESAFQQSQITPPLIKEKNKFFLTVSLSMQQTGSQPCHKIITYLLHCQKKYQVIEGVSDWIKFVVNELERALILRRCRCCCWFYTAKCYNTHVIRAKVKKVPKCRLLEKISLLRSFFFKLHHFFCYVYFSGYFVKHAFFRWLTFLEGGN